MGKQVDLTGTQVGTLTVLERRPSRMGKTQKKTRWAVKCHCGTVFEADTADLIRTDNRQRKSCGCENWRSNSRSPFWSGGTHVSGTYLGSCRRSALARGIDFDITAQMLDNLFETQSGVCALSGRHITIGVDASLDRIDSSQGYVVGNVQWVHKDFNKMKSNWNENDFIAMCKEVVTYRE